MSDFHDQFAGIAESVAHTAKGVLGAIDQMLFKALIACLKSDDVQAATIAIEQLAKEGKPLSVAPLYYVSKAHPSTTVQHKAEDALKSFKQGKKIAELTAGKDLEEAVKALIHEFGNYKQG